MNFKSTIIGLAASALLLALLAFARIFVVTAEVPDLTIREVETVIFDPPPPPPPPEDPPTDAPPPPAPTLTNLSTLPDPSRVPIPQADVPMDITLQVENFHADLAPAPLPISPEAMRVDQSKQFFKKEQNYTPAPPPVAKSHYSTSELDGTPRLLRHGSATFPASLARQGVSRGTVVFEVELSTEGSVSVRRVVSSTHPDLVAPARRVAASARFTPPKRNGEAVKAIMRWPIIIEK